MRSWRSTWVQRRTPRGNSLLRWENHLWVIDWQLPVARIENLHKTLFQQCACLYVRCARRNKSMKGAIYYSIIDVSQLWAHKRKLLRVQPISICQLWKCSVYETTRARFFSSLFLIHPFLSKRELLVDHNYSKQWKQNHKLVNLVTFSNVSLLYSSWGSCRTSTPSAWRSFMRLRRSWRTFGINLYPPARRDVSILWVSSQWWVHALFLLQHLRRAQLLAASLSHFCLVAQDSLAAEIEGTMRKELQMDDPDVEEQRYSYFPTSKSFTKKKGLGSMHTKC